MLSVLEKYPRGKSSNGCLTQVVSAGSVASSGEGHEQVTDLSHHNAFKLEPHERAISFHSGSTSILSNPTSSTYLLDHLATSSSMLTHLDTSHSEDMLGILVVCLPTQFTCVLGMNITPSPPEVKMNGD